jgi:SHS2 domain-containing protein
MEERMSIGAADARTIKGGYKTIEHTADTGIAVKSDSLAQLFAVSACAMFDLMGDLSGVSPSHKAAVSLSADSVEELFITWLNELIFRAEVSGMFFSKFEIESIDEVSLKASVWGEPYDEDKHSMSHSVKAATYHELEVTHSDSGWSARVIFDV